MRCALASTALAALGLCAGATEHVSTVPAVTHKNLADIPLVLRFYIPFAFAVEPKLETVLAVFTDLGSLLAAMDRSPQLLRSVIDYAPEICGALLYLLKEKDTPVAHELRATNRLWIKKLASTPLSIVRAFEADQSLLQLGNYTLFRMSVPRRPEDNDTCIVCFDAESTHLRMILPCGHNFCRPCIISWFNVRFVCPVCIAGPLCVRTFMNNISIFECTHAFEMLYIKSSLLIAGVFAAITFALSIAHYTNGRLIELVMIFFLGVSFTNVYIINAISKMSNSTASTLSTHK